MELGRYLVHELDFDDGVDTLGHWMAHYVAELIDRAENAPTAVERAKAKKLAGSTILRIWDHRASLPGKVYPLAPFRDALVVLARLRPSNNPFRYYAQSNEPARDQLAAELFDNLTRLVIALLFKKVRSLEEVVFVDNAAVEALGKEEQEILREIQDWVQLIRTGDKNAEGASKRTSKKSTNASEIDLGEIAVQSIDNMKVALDALRASLLEAAN